MKKMDELAWSSIFIHLFDLEENVEKFNKFSQDLENFEEKLSDYRGSSPAKLHWW